MNIKDATDDELQDELKRRENLPQIKSLSKDWPDSPIGVWKVTTEGDCEGKSTKTIGVFEGHVVDIALQLREQCFYSLNFSPASHIEIIDGNFASGDSVSIVLDIKSGTWPSGGMDKINRAPSINAWLNKDNPDYCEVFSVEEDNYYTSVKIVVE